MSALALVPAAFSQQSDQGDSGVGKLANPRMAGLPRGRVTDYENDPFIVEIEERLRCTCGCNLDVYTCRTTDFTCQTSPAMHREVIGLVDRGLNAEQVLDEFVAQHGELVLMAPPKRGFNIVGYVLPGVAITLVGATMLWMLARRTARKQLHSVVEGAAATVPAEMSSEDEARLKAELADLDG